MGPISVTHIYGAGELPPPQYSPAPHLWGRRTPTPPNTAQPHICGAAPHSPHGAAARWLRGAGNSQVRRGGRGGRAAPPKCGAEGGDVGLCPIDPPHTSPTPPSRPIDSPSPSPRWAVGRWAAVGCCAAPVGQNVWGGDVGGGAVEHYGAATGRYGVLWDAVGHLWGSMGHYGAAIGCYWVL